jgi:hypothetical protein
MCFREEPSRGAWLDAAVRGADSWMSHVPADRVAFWDFDDPAIPTTERDTGATAIAAAALLKLAQMGPEDRRARYRDFAEVARRSPHRPAPHGGRRPHRRLLQQAPGWSAGGRRQPLRVYRRLVLVLPVREPPRSRRRRRPETPIVLPELPLLSVQRRSRRSWRSGSKRVVSRRNPMIRWRARRPVTPTAPGTSFWRCYGGCCAAL